MALAAPGTKKADPKKAAAEQAARGDAWAVAGRCDEAAKAYRASLAVQPKNAVVQVRLAHCLAKTGGAGDLADRRSAPCDRGCGDRGRVVSPHGDARIADAVNCGRKTQHGHARASRLDRSCSFFRFAGERRISRILFGCDAARRSQCRPGGYDERPVRAGEHRANRLDGSLVCFG